MINLAPAGLRRYVRLDNKPRQKYGLFAKFSLSAIVAFEVANNPHIFLTRSKQHIKESNIHFYGTLNHFDTMLFSESQEQNE